MRRAAVVVAAAVIGLSVTACGSSKASPGVPTANLEPTVQLVLGACPGTTGAVATSVACPTGDTFQVTPTAGGSGRVGSVRADSVMVIKNLESGNRRVIGTAKGDQVFDTGVMHPRDMTTILLNAPGTISITETPGPGHTTLVVRPRPDTKS